VLVADVVDREDGVAGLARIDDPDAGHHADPGHGRRVHQRREQPTTRDTERERAGVAAVVAKHGQRSSRRGFGMERADRPRLGGDAVEEAQPAQRVLARGLEQKPRSHRPGRAGLLEDGDVVAVDREGARQRPAPDAEPDDPDAHAVSIPAT
jgi:hypothetical protein